MQLFTLYTIPPLLSSILFLILGVFVFLKNKKSNINIAFGFVCLVTFWWQFSWFILFNVQNEFLAYSIAKIGYIGIILIPVAFYHFFIIFLGKIKKFDKYLLYFSYFTVFVFEIILLTTNFFINDCYKYFWGFYPRANFIHPIYLFLLSVLVVRILYLLFLIFSKKRKGLYPYKYYQIKYILFAIIFYIFSVSDFVANYGIEFYPFGFLFILISLGIFAYTIVKHHLMDIKLALRHSFVIGSSVATILIFFAFTRMIISKFAWGDISELQRIIEILIFVVSIVSYSWIKAYFLKIGNKYFFTTLYDSSVLTASIYKIILDNIEYSTMYEKIFLELKNAFHMNIFGVMHYDQNLGKYVVVYNSGFAIGRKKFFQGNEVFHKIFMDTKKPIIIDEIRRQYRKDKAMKDFLDMLDKYKVAIMSPLINDDGILGILIFGTKETGDIYNHDDLDVLKVIGTQIATSIDIMKFYDNAKNYNTRLKKEIKNMKNELKISNKRLEILDDAKSEFVSIVSHQLRTPLTVIKGYASMILEGSFGKTQKEKRLALRKIFNSSERLIQMVENLLYLSRIESRKLSFDMDECDFEDLVKNTVDRYRKIAKEKKIKLIYRKSKKLIGKVRIDEEKIRLVIINLIDNAVQFASHGNVVIFTKLDNTNIVFSTSNIGPLILKKDNRNVFKKFSGDKRNIGIGLYISKRIMKGHNGKIFLRNKKDGKGVESGFILSQ